MWHWYQKCSKTAQIVHTHFECGEFFSCSAYIKGRRRGRDWDGHDNPTFARDLWRSGEFYGSKESRPAVVSYTDFILAFWWLAEFARNFPPPYSTPSWEGGDTPSHRGTVVCLCPAHIFRSGEWRRPCMHTGREKWISKTINYRTESMSSSLCLVLIIDKVHNRIWSFTHLSMRILVLHPRSVDRRRNTVSRSAQLLQFVHRVRLTEVEQTTEDADSSVLLAWRFSETRRRKLCFHDANDEREICERGRRRRAHRPRPTISAAHGRNHWGDRGSGPPKQKNCMDHAHFLDEECDYRYVTHCSARNWVYHPYFLLYNNLDQGIGPPNFENVVAPLVQRTASTGNLPM